MLIIIEYQLNLAGRNIRTKYYGGPYMLFKSVINFAILKACLKQESSTTNIY